MQDVTWSKYRDYLKFWNSIGAAYIFHARAIPNTGQLYIDNGYLRVMQVTHLLSSSCTRNPHLGSSKENLSETL